MVSNTGEGEMSPKMWGVKRLGVKHPGRKRLGSETSATPKIGALDYNTHMDVILSI